MANPESGSRLKTIAIAEKPQLTAGKIFASPYGEALTNFGVIIQSIFIRNDQINTDQMSDIFRTQLSREIDERCVEAGIKPSDLSVLKEQWLQLVRDRRKLTIKKFPLDNSSLS